MARTFKATAFSVLILATSFGGAFANPDSGEIEKGRYLVTAGGCVTCHTNPGGAPFAGNRAIQTPFGEIYSSNITPDKETGIGTYSDEQFYRAMHNGIAPGGEYLYPAMPFTSFTKVSREDVEAIKAYLFSLKPVHSQKKENKLPFPFSVRETLAVWRAAFFHPGEFKPDPEKTPQINRGAYLVQGLAHCGECHTPRDIAGAPENELALEGAHVQGWYAPDLTPDKSRGIGKWSEAQLLSFLKTGASPEGTVMGPMAEAVHSDLRHLTDDDVRAIIAYLKSLPPKREEAARALPTNPAAGGSLYLSQCASCHQINGQGLSGKVPALAGNGAVKARGPEDVIRVILGGLPARDTYAPMPSFASSLSDGDIAALANYVRSQWGNDAPTNADGFLVAELRKKTPVMLVLGEGASQCPAHLDGDAKKVFDKANESAGDVFKALNGDTPVLGVENLVPRMKAAAPSASTAAIVNGLTAAYCMHVAANHKLSHAEKRNRLNIFSQLAYTEAVTGDIAPSPAHKAKQERTGLTPDRTKKIP